MSGLDLRAPPRAAHAGRAMLAEAMKQLHELFKLLGIADRVEVLVDTSGLGVVTRPHTNLDSTAGGGSGHEIMPAAWVPRTPPEQLPRAAQVVLRGLEAPFHDFLMHVCLEIAHRSLVCVPCLQMA